MPDRSVRQFLKRTRFDSATGVHRLLPSAAKGSLRYFLTKFVFYAKHLTAYQQLAVNDRLPSDNGFLNLILSADGNLVLYPRAFDHPLWASNTEGLPAGYVIMQPDGNLVAYPADGTIR
jgi:hypothetical protein